MFYIFLFETNRQLVNNERRTQDFGTTNECHNHRTIFLYSIEKFRLLVESHCV